MTSPSATNIDQTLGRYRRMFDLRGKIALVLGAASGIGKASAEAFFALGATVICADIDEQAVQETAASIGGKAHVVDAGKSEDIRKLAANIKAEHARLDIAFTTPATHVRKLMCDYTDEEYDRVANLNLRGTFYFLREFGKLMARQRHRAEHRRDAARRAAQGAPAHLPGARRPHRVQSLERAERGRRRGRVSCLRRRELRHRQRASGRRRLDRDRRPAHRADADPLELRIASGWSSRGRAKRGARDPRPQALPDFPVRCSWVPGSR